MAGKKREALQGEHPLMSNRTLRAMFTSLASARAHLTTQIRSKPAQADTACLVAPLTGLVSMDIAFDCRTNGLLQRLRPKSHPPIPQPLNRLYAAIGAAMTSTGKPPQPIIVAFFERQEIGGRGWREALTLAAPLPLLLIVLPRSKGREDTLDLANLARAANLPAIPVDSQDTIALYRVSQESLGRARTGGGAALIETFHLDGPPAIDKLETFLTTRGVASRSWIDKSRIDRTLSNFPNAPAKRKGS